MCCTFQFIFVRESFPLCRFQPGSATLGRRSCHHPGSSVGWRAHGQPVHHAGGDDGAAGSADGTRRTPDHNHVSCLRLSGGLGLWPGVFVVAAVTASVRLPSAAPVDSLTSAAACWKQSPVMKSGQTLVRQKKAVGECTCHRCRSSGGVKSTFHLAPLNCLHQDSPSRCSCLLLSFIIFPVKESLSDLADGSADPFSFFFFLV